MSRCSTASPWAAASASRCMAATASSTERTLFAMPETGIGFFPDVGGTWFLPRCPGEVGMWLGLTGARLHGADCLDAGLGTHAVPAARLGRAGGGAGSAAGAARRGRRGARPAWPSCRAQIGEQHLPALRRANRRLLRRRRAWTRSSSGSARTAAGFGAAQLAAARQQVAARGRALTFAQLRRGRELDHRGRRCGSSTGWCTGCSPAHDFAEGVRALLVDKDRRPRWRHAALVQVIDGRGRGAAWRRCRTGDLEFDWNGI